GHYSLWAWASEPELVGEAIKDQEDYRLEPWFTVLDTPGTASIAVLKGFFSSGEWGTLRPAAELLVEQPGDRKITDFQAVGRSASGDWLVAYVPTGGVVRLRAEASAGMSARWFDPRSGHWQAAQRVSSDADEERFATPDSRDWLLDLRR
ncbi:MAG: hypothetical protein FWD74_03240, partial [Actinomycetia bacterium]|nr:hypothetical protein [Actinomycetes bacterium]